MTQEKLQDALDRAWEAGYFNEVYCSHSGSRSISDLKVQACELLFGAKEAEEGWRLVIRGDFRNPIRVDRLRRLHDTDPAQVPKTLVVVEPITHDEDVRYGEADVLRIHRMLRQST
jgi:hypothetical protein